MQCHSWIQAGCARWILVTLTTVVTLSLPARMDIPRVICHHGVTCLTDDCIGDTSCYHGTCGQDGLCRCDTCWEGQECKQYINTHRPLFLENRQAIQVQVPWPDEDVPIFTVTATDDDTSQCSQHHDSDSCPCTRIIYTIIMGNDDSAFTINQSSGDIRFSQDSLLSPGDIRTLLVSASNPVMSATGGAIERFSSTHSVFTLAISLISGQNQFRSGWFDGNREFHPPMNSGYASIGDPFFKDGRVNMENKAWNEPHSRGKRAVVVIPDTVTFSLSKTDPYLNVAELNIASKVSFVLEIHFPTGSTDILVELFTPDNGTIVMKMCNVQVGGIGTNLAYTSTAITPVMEASDGTQNYDHAIIDFGNVTNSAADVLDPEQSKIYIYYDVIMLTTPQNSTEYWVSAGAEYNQLSEIWIGQISFLSVLDAWKASMDPVINFNGPTSMAAGSSSVFSLAIQTPYDAMDLSVDIFTPFNTSDIMSVCDIGVTGVGQHIACLSDTEQILFRNTGEAGNWHGRLKIPSVLNSDARTLSGLSADHTVSLDFVVKLENDDTLVNQEVSVAAAMEIGPDLIWAGTLPVTVLAPTEAQHMTQKPTFSVTAVTGYDAPLGFPTALSVDMSVPANTDADYVLDAQAPFEGPTPLFHICKMRLVYTGANVACIPEVTAEYTSRDSSTVMDRAVLNLGRIMHLGRRSDVEDEKANLVQFEVILLPLNISLNIPGTEKIVTLGMRFSVDQLWVSNAAFTITDESMANSSRPDMDVRFNHMPAYVPIGGSTEMLLEITTTPGNTYQPMVIEFIMPDNDSLPVFTICRAEIVFVGRNLPCLNKDMLNDQFTYTTTALSDKPHRAELNIGALSSVGLDQTNLTENKLILSVVFAVEDHAVLENGTAMWVSAGVVYSDLELYVGQLDVFALRDTPADYNNLGITPTMQVDIVPSTDPTPVGYTTMFNILLNLPPLSTLDYKVGVTSLSSYLGVCNVWLIDSGKNVPCVDESIRPNFIKFDGTQTNKVASLNLGALSNIGADVLSITTDLDWNTVRLRMAAKLSNDPDVVQGSTHDIEVKLTSGSVSSTVTRTITATLDTSEIVTPFIGVIGVSMYTLELAQDVVVADKTIAKGQTKRVVADFYLPAGISHHVTITLLTPVTKQNYISIVQAGIIFVGVNLGCLDKRAYKPVYNSRLDSTTVDTAEFQLGLVNHIPVSQTTDASTIRVEMLAMLLPTSPNSDGYLYALNAAIRVDTELLMERTLSLIQVDTFSITFTEPSPTPPVVNVNVSAVPVVTSIGEIFTLPLVINVPVNHSMQLNSDIDLPVSDSAVMTIQSMRIISVGANVILMEGYLSYIPEYNSTQETSQNDNAVLELGIVTNTGLTYRTETWSDADDQIIIEYVVQMADSVIADDQTSHVASIGVNIGPYVVVIQIEVRVHRTGNERPELDLTATCDNSRELIREDELSVSLVLKHLETSSAESREVDINLYLPPYMEFVSLDYYNATSATSVERGTHIQINITTLFFTDVLGFTLTFRVKADAVTQYAPSDAITAYDVISVMHNRLASIYPDGAEFASEMKTLRYKVSAVEPSAVPPCDGALGMEDGAIRDCQISGCYSPDSSKQPEHARFNGLSGWKPFIRPGLYQDYRYIQVYFGDMVEVVRVRIQHPVAFLSERVKNLLLRYSNDGQAWTSGDTLVASDTYTDREDMVVKSSRASRYIRVYIMSNTGSEWSTVGVKFEFFGCKRTNDVPDPCETVGPSGPKPEYYIRGFLGTSTRVFICDADPNNNLEMRCFYSNDGSEWRALGQILANIIGHNPSTGKVYGLDRKHVTYMRSDDQGVNWYTISELDWQNDNSDIEFIRHKAVPWDSDSRLTVAEPHIDFQFDNTWGATAHGIFLNNGGWTQVITWDTCCP